MPQCPLCSGDVLLHICRNQLFWHCDHCRARIPDGILNRYRCHSAAQEKFHPRLQKLKVVAQVKPAVISQQDTALLRL
ncbi:MAG: hypothetical protein HC851_17530 [Acaryochloris sp. RU_4_1]|nr:hypothetical protein [Acaryochloris sp. RU_4_1]NJR57231.1 hypothetical protein [Acaryochloris sp. CRU_2_0]